MTDVSIAIVTYHSALVLDALTHDLRAQRDVSYEVLFTDNGSTDGTVETLANLWPGRTQANSSTLGYTAAQRQNLARAAGRYVLFLNPDTRFDATLVKQLRHFLDSHPQFAIVGPSVQEDGYSFFFYSNDHVPIHVHVRRGGGEAVFVVEPEVELRESVGLNVRELSRAEDLIDDHLELIKQKWAEHLG
jgi:GT2 family glycosyltransferase